MKLLFTLILALIYFCGYGQETLEIKTKNEIYTVLKGSTEVKHGEYKKLRKKTIVEMGTYDNGERIGKWSFYDNDGNVEMAYDFTSKTVLQNLRSKQFTDYKIGEDGTEPEMLPLFIGGRSRYDRFIQENLVYPKESKSKGVEGRQLVIITLSETGIIVESKIYRSISSDIDKEALRLISELPEDWLPGQNNGKNVTVILTLPVLFKL